MADLNTSSKLHFRYVLKRKIFIQCIKPVLVYGEETGDPTINGDKVPNTEIPDRTKVAHAIAK